MYITLGILSALSVVPTLFNLRKHEGRSAREGKRRERVVWYWILFLEGVMAVSAFAGTDVDRYFLQEMPIVLQCFFYTLMVPVGLVMVWEGARNWERAHGRRVVDGDGDGNVYAGRKKRKVGIWKTLVFYSLVGGTFFATIPRSWTPVRRQNYEWETRNVARVAALDVRNKTGAILAVGAWAVIVFSIQDTIRGYGDGKISACPRKLWISVGLLAIRLAYGIAATWSWDVTIFNKDVGMGWPFGLGYAPILLILVTFNLAGFCEKNEDRQIARRIARGRVQDGGLDVGKKPRWWNRNAAAFSDSSDEKMDGRATTGAVEMNLVGQRSADQIVGHRFTDEDSDDHQGSGPSGTRTQANGSVDATPKAGGQSVPLLAPNDAQQPIRSMLDV